jgi:hypothetical protein
MDSALKFVLLAFFVYLIGMGFYKAYKFCNDKITGSSSGWELLAFSLLLIIINVILLVGGLYALVETFRFLS